MRQTFAWALALLSSSSSLLFWGLPPFLYFPLLPGQSYSTDCFPGVLLLCLYGSIKRCLKSQISLLIITIFPYAVFFPRFLCTSLWPCSPETIGLRTPAWDALWREARLRSSTGIDPLKDMFSPQGKKCAILPLTTEIHKFFYIV